MRIRDKKLTAVAAVGLGLWMCLSVPAQSEPSTAGVKKSVDAPVELSKFNKRKTHAAARTKTKAAEARPRAKLSDAASRGKTAKSDDALDKLAVLPSVANARAELTAGNPLSSADDEARNLAATDDSEVVTMNGVQIASADQLNDMDRAVSDDKTEVKSDDVTSAVPAPAPPAGRIVKAVPSGERHVFRSDDSTPWSSTSLIGKIFVAFGSLLTLASAARLFIA